MNAPTHSWIRFTGSFVLLLVLGLVVAVTPSSAKDPLILRWKGLNFLHPIKHNHPEGCGRDQWIPHPEAAQCVHVYMINGLDPVCKGNYNGVVLHLREHGYPNTFFGQLTHHFQFEKEIVKLKTCQPHAKVALVGFSLGANSVRAIANSLKKKGIEVDLLVYIAGDFIYDKEKSRPCNVRRVVTIRGHGLWCTGYDLVNGEDLSGARNERINCRHIATPTHPRSLAILREELWFLTQPTSVPAEGTLVEPAPLLHSEVPVPVIEMTPPPR